MFFIQLPFIRNDFGYFFQLLSIANPDGAAATTTASQNFISLQYFGEVESANPVALVGAFGTIITSFI